MLIDDVKPIRDTDAVNERADDLAAAALNGLRLVLVTVGPPAPNDTALLEVYFLNSLHVAEILADVVAAPNTVSSVFRIRGGQRLPAGPATGQVKVIAVASGSTDSDGELISLVLTVDTDRRLLDLHARAERRSQPHRSVLLGAEVQVPARLLHERLQPGMDAGARARHPPPIDYLAKDFDSFRHTMIAAMMERVPGWQSTSEADLDQVLIDLFAAAGDELSDYQDRVMNEAYLGSARKRVSIARHARLVDYHINQGNQSATWLAVVLADGTTPFLLGEDLVAWAGHPDDSANWIYFATRQVRLPAAERTLLDPVLNELSLYSWTDAIPALRAGTTTADVVSTVTSAGQPEAERVRDLINDGTLTRLLLEEKLNPLTGRSAGFDPRKRQTLRLVPNAVALRDPLTDQWMTRVNWEEADALKWSFSFVTTCPDGRVDGVSAFHGNLLRTYQGVPVVTHFYEPGTDLPMDTGNETHRYYTRRLVYGEPRGVLCALPLAPLAYLKTPLGGEVPPQSTLYVDVEDDGIFDPWDEVESLVHSDDSAEEGDHFVVETDERQRSVLRFGNGTNGRWLPDDAVVHCDYQVGGGAAGNVGANAVQWFRDLALQPAGDDRSALESIRRHRRARSRAGRANSAQCAGGLSRTTAARRHAGGLHRARRGGAGCFAGDGALRVDRQLAHGAHRHRPGRGVDARRLVARCRRRASRGGAADRRGPRAASAALRAAGDQREGVHLLRLLARRRALRARAGILGRVHVGRPARLLPSRRLDVRPDAASSEIEGRLQSVAGVDHVISVEMQRFGRPASTTVPGPASLDVGVDEIIEVENDPDHLERGSIDFDLQGGRR